MESKQQFGHKRTGPSIYSKSSHNRWSISYCISFFRRVDVAKKNKRKVGIEGGVTNWKGIKQIQAGEKREDTERFIEYVREKLRERDKRMKISQKIWFTLIQNRCWIHKFPQMILIMSYFSLCSAPVSLIWHNTISQPSWEKGERKMKKGEERER